MGVDLRDSINLIRAALEHAVEAGDLDLPAIPDVVINRNKDSAHGDFASRLRWRWPNSRVANHATSPKSSFVISRSTTLSTGGNCRAGLHQFSRETGVPRWSAKFARIRWARRGAPGRPCRWSSCRQIHGPPRRARAWCAYGDAVAALLDASVLPCSASIT